MRIGESLMNVGNFSGADIYNTHTHMWQATTPSPEHRAGFTGSELKFQSSLGLAANANVLQWQEWDGLYPEHPWTGLSQQHTRTKSHLDIHSQGHFLLFQQQKKEICHCISLTMSLPLAEPSLRGAHQRTKLGASSLSHTSACATQD